MAADREVRIADDVAVRTRNEVDLPALAAIVERAHKLRNYPQALPDDPAGWLTGALARSPFSTSFVAVRNGEVVGHVATATAIGDRAEQTWSGALGMPAESLSVVKRLVVDPAHEGAGIGRLLLATAVAASHERGLWPVLDTVDQPSRAVRLYERAGWRPVGTVVIPAGDGGWRGGAVLRCFAGPAPARLAAPSH